MAKRILTGTKRMEVTAAALERNVGMQQRGMDLLAEQNPGYTILVSEATNEDLGLRAYVKRLQRHVSIGSA
jgi:hypothetical protein